MKLGKKKKQRLTKPYLPRVLEQIDAENIAGAYRLIQEAAVDYFTRFSPVTDTIPTDDAALLIHLYRHMANELERAVTPETKKAVEALEKIALPPIEYQKKK